MSLPGDLKISLLSRPHFPYLQKGKETTIILNVLLTLATATSF